jgi:tryptophanyl-tRNA synthetase
MSSSDPNSAIFLTDSPEDIERKIMHHAFSGGRETKAEQQKHGANLEVDVSFQWLRFFLDDDDELETIRHEYGTGTGQYWNTSAVKKRLAELLQDLVAKHKIKRDKISDDDVRKWMQVRPLKPPPTTE